METKTKRPSRKKPSAKASESSIKTEYIRHVLDFGGQPVSVFKFCTSIGVSEDEFYKQFGSFAGLERNIWKDVVAKAIERIKADDSYMAFSAREKILALYYTLFEELMSLRSFALIRLNGMSRVDFSPDFLKDFHQEFDRFLDTVLLTGKSTGEIASRPLVDKSYPSLFWLQMKFLLGFWLSDTSSGLENTDAAIEKSVNVAFDLIGAGALDTVLDFAKFMYQTRGK